MVNGLRGLSIESITIEEEGDTNILEDHVPYYGESVFLWLGPGTFDLRLTDEIGREARLEDLALPDTGRVYLLTPEEMRSNADTFHAGQGDGSICITNGIPAGRISRLQAISEGESFVHESAIPTTGLAPGDRMMLSLPTGIYEIHLQDVEGNTYFAVGIPARPDTFRLTITIDHLAFDFPLRGW
jgi:hypothetical protein